MRSILSLALYLLVLLCEYFGVELGVEALVLCDFGSVVLVRLAPVRAGGGHGCLGVLACLLEVLLVPV